MHEAGNPFDRFAIKTVKENGEIVGHLPREISRVTKFYLDRGATMYCELSSNHYRRSPLVQGGLEIACRVIVKMRATKLNQRLSEHYMQLVAQIYSDPAEDTVVGHIQFSDDVFTGRRQWQEESCKRRQSRKLQRYQRNACFE